MKLKTKLVLMSVAISSLMCITITASAMFSVQGLTSAMMEIEPAIAAPVQPQSSTSGFFPESDEAVNKVGTAAMLTQPATVIEAQRAFSLGRIYVMLAIVALGGVCTWIFAGRILRPLEALTLHVRNTSPETLTQPMPIPKTDDEVGKLSEAFGLMSAQVGAAYDLQKSFAASAAHELRTPLSVLSAEVEVFRMQPQHTALEQEEFAHTIQESTRRLNTLVEDLLSLTNQSNITMEESVELRTMLEEITFELANKAAEKDIKLTVIGESFAVTGNDGLLQRAFYNLAENAVKYTPPHGSAVLELVARERMVKVYDTGYGVSDDDKPYIFEPFYRAEKSRSRTAGGSGLGLAIVRQIVLRHGASISVEDNTPRGTVFVIKFI